MKDQDGIGFTSKPNTPSYELNILFSNTRPISTGMEANLRSSARGQRAAILNNGSAESPNMRFLLSLILCSGDIQLNPGPRIKVLCGECAKSVRSNQKAIQCDGCDSWFHKNCGSISDLMYNVLSDSACTWPVSLTSISCNFMEHVVYSQIMKHLDRNNILMHYQLLIILLAK